MKTQKIKLGSIHGSGKSKLRAEKRLETESELRVFRIQAADEVRVTEKMSRKEIKALKAVAVEEKVERAARARSAAHETKMQPVRTALKAHLQAASARGRA